MARPFGGPWRFGVSGLGQFLGEFTATARCCATVADGIASPQAPFPARKGSGSDGSPPAGGFDYYDRASFGTGHDLGSEDPSDPAKTTQSLLIYLIEVRWLERSLDSPPSASIVSDDQGREYMA